VPLRSIEFTEVRINEGVDPQEFRYVPPKGVDEVDETQLYLAMIKQLRMPVQPPAENGAPVNATPAGGRPPAVGPQVGPQVPTKR
jgi:hypothetical protein